ncbi:EamA family transporter [Novosphingobium sp. YJ-S2-02]|uniref:EamA family transporter n=1 Tax=Novosphingobium aureum TaxID=2792964 RepID=A0A931MJU5_9SPHN|nr:EamA family transporter [Novosphingobium aureum]MBH0112177.1 EamA family transporter [Novosphingobium aureum]
MTSPQAAPLANAGPALHAPLLASAQIVFAQVSINFGAALAKGLFVSLAPEQVAALRSGIAALLLLALVRPWRRRAAFSRRDIGWCALYGLALGGMNLMMYAAFERIAIGIACAIEICGPLAVVLLTTRRPRDFAWLALAIGGLVLLMPWPGRAHASDPVGIALALGAAACWALYIMLGRRAARVGAPNAVAIGMVAACLVTVPAGLARGLPALDAPVLALAATVAVLSSALPYVLEMRAMGQLPSRVVGLISSAGPATAALIGFVVLGEALGPWQWLAIAVLVTASAGCSLGTAPPVSKLREEPLT